MLALAFTLAATALAIVYIYVEYLYLYWQRRGIPYLKPSFPFGNCGNVFIQRIPLGYQLAQLYRKTAEPFIGIFMLQAPFLLIRDPKLIRSILITEFQHFTDRKFHFDEKEEPMSEHLYALQGQSWRDLRAELTSAFTPNKMKMIFSSILDCDQKLQAYLSKMVNAKQAIEMYEVGAGHASNIMASVWYGIDVDCLADPNHPLRNAERQMFDINLKNGARFIGLFFQPKLMKLPGLRCIDRAIGDYFMTLMAHTLKMRENTKIERNDFVQLLINTMKTEKSEQKSLTFEQVAAQAFALFIAGVESVRHTTACCLYEIAKHSDIQRKANAEMEYVLHQQNNDQLTYESINELKYLDCCIEETLRRYQLLDLSRVCVKDYKIPGSDVTIEKGTTLMIPTFALHHDEKFYPDPEKFDPTRFSSENRANKSIIEMPYLATGDGPRNCIGQKMGKIIAKFSICSILRQYHIDLDDRHIGKQLKQTFNFYPVGGIHLKLTAKQ